MKTKKRISFDFDGTLEFPIVQEYAKKMINNGHEVFIITGRDDEVAYAKRYFIPDGFAVTVNKDVFLIGDKIGIDKSNIYFTNSDNKYHTVEELGIDLHIDNEMIECSLILEKTSSTGICIFGNPEWIKQADIIVNEERPIYIKQPLGFFKEGRKYPFDSDTQHPTEEEYNVVYVSHECIYSNDNVAIFKRL